MRQPFVLKGLESVRRQVRGALRTAVDVSGSSTLTVALQHEIDTLIADALSTVERRANELIAKIRKLEDEEERASV